MKLGSVLLVRAHTRGTVLQRPLQCYCLQAKVINWWACWNKNEKPGEEANGDRSFVFIWIQTLHAANASVFCELFFWTELKKTTDAITTSLYNPPHTLTDSIYEHFYSCRVGLVHSRELWEDPGIQDSKLRQCQRVGLHSVSMLLFSCITSVRNHGMLVYHLPPHPWEMMDIWSKPI